VAEALGVAKIATGDLFRDHQRRETELGRMARTFMERGALVPDEVTIKIIMGWINAPEQGKGFVLDGFPRTLGQASAIDKELEVKGGLDTVLYINVPEDELIRRLSGRMICRDCQMPYHQQSSPPKEAGKCDKCGGEIYQRDDDKIEAVRNRIKVYAEETEPLVQYYQKANKLEEVDGQGSIDEVGQALISKVS
jgi:adenylate kinase